MHRLKGEIFFSRAQWRLTETDGQLGIADAAIVNFSYTKSVMKNDSIEHLMEMGSIHVKNLLKEQLYVDVIFPSKLRNVPLDRQRTLRVFCRYLVLGTVTTSRLDYYELTFLFF